MPYGPADLPTRSLSGTASIHSALILDLPEQVSPESSPPSQFMQQGLLASGITATRTSKNAKILVQSVRGCAYWG